MFSLSTSADRAPREPASSVFPATVADDQALLPDLVTEAGGEPGGKPGKEPGDHPSHIGRYAVRGVLARGGLGMVYDAWDPLLARPVALKTLRPQPEPSTLDGLILQEARFAAALNHHGIVTVFDAGLSPQGVYIAMEKLPGQDLRSLLKTGWHSTPLQAATLVRRVADALAYAHAQGVVHCDVKPGNIFITPRGRQERPVLLDFGIARAASASGRPGPAWVAGSPHYVAPEQAQGKSVDGRTDVYALGAVLYELLAGRKAFEGLAPDAIQRAVQAGPPTAPHRWRSEVPAALSRVAMRAMAMRPDERFAGAAEFAGHLRQWLEVQQAAAEEPIALRRPWWARWGRPG
jgi:eukaryotic-like serine/threonine-protein kinase